MLIRSQNKEKLLPIGNIEIEHNGYGKLDEIDNYRISINSDRKGFTIGRYSTKTKALKVLDMIEKCHKYHTLRYGSDRSDYAVFQMPQDDEVQA